MTVQEKRRVCILQCARLGSQRVPRKMLAKVGGKTLLDIGLDKLVKIEKTCGAKPLLAIHEGDRELADAASAKGIELFYRDELSVTSEAYNDCYGGWSARLAPRFDWALLTNIICRPFIKCCTIIKMHQAAQTYRHAFVTVIRNRGILWDEKHTCLLGQGQTADTRGNPVYYSLAHMGYGMPISVFDDEAAVVKDQQLLELQLAEEEAIDIDTPAQLEFACRLGAVLDTSGD